MPILTELDRLRQSVNSVPSLIAYVTAGERFALANQTFQDWFGIRPTDIIGRKLQDVMGAERYASIEPYIDRALGGERCSYPLDLTSAAGVRRVTVLHVPDIGAGGTVHGYIALGTDVTESKRLEADLRDQAAATATLHQVGQMVAAELDLDRLVQNVTAAMAAASGAEFGAFYSNLRSDQAGAFELHAVSGVGRDKFSPAVAPATPAFTPLCGGLEPLRAVDVTSDPRYLAAPPAFTQAGDHLPIASYLAIPLVSRSGESFGGFCFAHARPGVFTGKTESLLVGLASQAAVGIEKSLLFTALERERAQAQAAARSAAFLSEASQALAASLNPRTTFTALADLAARFFGDCCVLDVFDNGVFDRLAASHVNPLLQPVLDELKHYNVVPHEGNRMWTVLKTGRTEKVNRIPDGILEAHVVERRHLELLQTLNPTAYMIVPLLGGGRAHGVMSIFATGSARTYTEEDQRAAEELAYRVVFALKNARLYAEAQEANRLKDEFLAIVSHELRTPLNAMRGWTSLLRSMPLDAAQQARALEVIDRNIGAQTQLVEDLLDISRIVSGRMRLTVQPLDLEEVIRSATESLRPAADARRIELETTLDTGAGPVLGDPDRMQQVVWNLLSNAIKFTPPGGRVHVQLRRAGAFMELVVSDTGSGIEPGFLPHVFERFRQGDGTTTRPIGGLGLGLAIVRHLVELHGGVVEAASPGTGLGAVFTVRLPLMLEQRPSADAGHERVSAQLRTLSMARRLDGVRVLSVDNDEESAELLSLVLRAAGAEVHTASGTAAALEEAERWHPQIIVADVEMPGEDGYSLVQKLHASAGPGPRPLAIAVTAYARREDRLRALAAGFQSHVPKPVDPAEIVAAVANLLGRAGADPVS